MFRSSDASSSHWLSGLYVITPVSIDVPFQSLLQAKDIKKIYDRKQKKLKSQIVSEGWTHSTHRWARLNMDGLTRGNPGAAGGVRILKNE